MKALNTVLSKKLRHKQTPWEAKLWKYLRAKRVWQHKFKRQVPIGNFIVDFCCQKQKLIIELDGGQHSVIPNKLSDLEREKYLKAKQYTILRFWNNQIDDEIESVLATIDKYLEP